MSVEYDVKVELLQRQSHTQCYYFHLLSLINSFQTVLQTTRIQTAKGNKTNYMFNLFIVESRDSVLLTKFHIE